VYADAEFESRVMTTKNILDTYLGLPVIGTLSIIGVWVLHKLRGPCCTIWSYPRLAAHWPCVFVRSKNAVIWRPAGDFSRN
jgi:hypothetical protein